MPFAEDLSTFFNPAEFATKAWLDWVEVDGIFGAEPVNAFDAIASTAPTFLLPTSRCRDAVIGSRLLVGGSLVKNPAPSIVNGGTEYRVCDIKHGTDGTTKLHLEKLP